MVSDRGMFLGSKRSLRYIPLIILLVTPILVSQYYGSTIASDQQGVSVTQIPGGSEVESMRPVIILINAVGNISLDISINIKAELNKSVPGISLPAPLSGSFSIPVLPVSASGGYSIGVIPGLPAYRYVFDRPLVGRVALTITSSVNYSVLVNGSVAYRGGYVVQPLEYAGDLPPLVSAIVYDVLNNPDLINETLGLAPPGWVAGFGREVRVVVVALDDKNISDVKLEYSVSGSAWQTTPLEDMAPQLDSVRNLVNDWLNNVEAALKTIKPDFSLPRLGVNFKVELGVIPGQQAGEYVFFRATAIDVAGHATRSLLGLYYVVNTSSPTRILVVDPSVELWVLKNNTMELTESIKRQATYGFPDKALETARNYSMVQKMLEYHGPPFFHYWNNLGRDYNLYIVYPGRRLGDALKTFKPRVIILSNLYLGLNVSTTLNWDLRDQGVLGELISYVKQNHAGVIATHGVLSDWIIWSIDCSTKVKVGSRGHVGGNVSDLNPIEEETVAALLGLSELALWEYARDLLASLICSGALAVAGVPVPPEVGALVGSTPLLIPYAPFSGVLRTTQEAQYAGWTLPDEFTVSIPEASNVFGFNAYTTVGWQLALPRAAAYAAWDKLWEVRDRASNAINKYALLVENATGRFASRGELYSYVDSAMSKWIKEWYRALASSTIKRGVFSLNVSLPQGVVRFNISLPSKALEGLLQKLPVKVIAVSSDGLAGIVIHDKYWDRNGYRAVYFSFELEASNDPVGSTLFKQAVDWVLRWEYKPVTELLGSVRVPKEVGDTFKNTIEKLPGDTVLNQSIILNEEGASWIEIPAKPGRIHVVVAHPTTDKIEVAGVEGDLSVVATTSTNRVTTITLEVRVEASIKIGLKASSDASLNPAYIQVKLERVTETTTPTPPQLTPPTTTPPPTPIETSPTTTTPITTAPPPTPATTPQPQPTSTSPTSQPTTPIQVSSPTSTPLTTTPTTIQPTVQPSPVQTTTTTPSGGINTYMVLGVATAIIALLAIFLATRRKH